MDPELHEALLRAAVAEAAVARLEQQVAQLQQQVDANADAGQRAAVAEAEVARLERQLEANVDAGQRAAAAEAEVAQLERQVAQLQQQGNDNINFMRHQIDGNDQFMRNLGNQNSRFMRDMAASVLGRMVNTDRFNAERATDISNAVNDNHRVNGARAVRQELQPYIMLMERRDGDRVVGKIRRGQLRHINREQAKLADDGFQLVEKTPVGNAISTAQHLVANVNLGIFEWQPYGYIDTRNFDYNNRRGLRPRNVNAVFTDTIDTLREMPEDLRTDSDTIEDINEQFWQTFIGFVRLLYNQAEEIEHAVNLRGALNRLMNDHFDIRL